MGQSRSKDHKKKGVFERLLPDTKKPPLILNENTRRMLEEVDPKPEKKKKK